MSRFRQLQVFSQVARHRSMVKAAEALGISPPAVSKQLSRLEEELGVILLERSTRRVSLTSVGERYLEHCERVLAELQEAEGVISEELSEPRGCLRIVSGRHFAARFILPHLKEFFEKFPLLSVHLELAERMPDLVTENVDILIGMSLSAPENCLQKRILSTRYVLCASPEYLATHGVPQSAEALRDHWYLNHSQRNPNDRLLLKGGREVELRPRLLLNDVEAMADLAVQGMGIIMVHDYVVEERIRKGLLVEILKEELEPDLPIFAAFPPRRYQPNKVRCFMEFIEAAL